MGSGDGRIAYCSTLLGLRSFSVEIDSELALLQRNIASSTGTEFEILNVDAIGFEYGSLNLSRPVFFISGLPQSGDMLAIDVLKRAKNLSEYMRHRWL